MNFEDTSFKNKYRPERVLATLGKRRANGSILKLSLVEWDGHPDTMDLRIWYSSGDKYDLPAKGIMFSRREALILLWGLIDYFRSMISEVEQANPRPDESEDEDEPPQTTTPSLTSVSSF